MSPLLRKADLALAAALALGVLCAAIALLGPGRARMDGAHASAVELRARIEDWARVRAGYRPPTEIERAGWRSRWDALLTRTTEVEGDAALIADVGARLDVGGLRRFQVTPQLEPSEPRGSATELRAPAGDGHIALEGVPLEVSFLASYSELLAVLERVERGGAPARIEALEIRRQRPGVAVKLRLTWWIRVPTESAS